MHQVVSMRWLLQTFEKRSMRKRRRRQHLDGISVSRESRHLLRARSGTNSSAIAISNVMCPLKYLIYLKSIHGNDGFDSVPCERTFCESLIYMLKPFDKSTSFFLLSFISSVALFIFDLSIYVFSQAVKM